ncbi:MULTISPECIES: hypothetical protein [unclassified Nocardiopsis]|uniref:hypothetical protein n=1 Tax=unclassified Nocardiopsis TaxID=2649073 RepID=UPI00093BFF98|nr:hypothetical protein [Nocardiopsis sp. TSRI0078]
MEERVRRWAGHTRYSGPGVYAPVLERLPEGVEGIGRVVRGVLAHYRAGGVAWSGARLAEIDHRWVESMLATDAVRDGRPWAAGRRVPLVGCCRDYVLLELAHRQGDEVLLWDSWGVMERWGDSGLVDEVAGLLVAADGGDGAAEEELAAWYARDGRLRPRGRVYCASPSGYRGWVDLVRRVGEPAV